MRTIKDLLQDTKKTNVIVGAANPLIAELVQRSGFDGL